MSHYKQDWEKGLYRSRDGVLLGVCQGLSNHFDMAVIWVRVLFVLITFWTGLFPGIAGYIILGLMMKPEPVVPFQNKMDREFYDSYTSSKSLALHRLKETYENLDRRDSDGLSRS